MGRDPVRPGSAGALRVLVTGGAGLLGSTLLRIAPSTAELHATRRRTAVQGANAHTIELSEADAVVALWRRLRPELVIHTAYSATDGERDILEATRSVVAGCEAVGAGLIYLSTDALLDGESGPYAEAAEPAPVHEYGEWKARAERLVRERIPRAAVVRTSLISCFAPLDPRGASIAEGLRARRPVTLFVDELRCPIAAVDLARQIWEIAALPVEERGGVWHLAGPEALSRYALGLLVAAHQGLDPAGITPARSTDAPVRRPRDVRLLTARADAALQTRARPVSELVLGSRPEDLPLAPRAAGGGTARP